MFRNIELGKELSKIPQIAEIDNLKREVDLLRPLSKETEQRILQKFRLDWNYHSNAIEGNPYTYGETVAFLMEGITAKGKTLKDHLDIKGHDESITYLLKVVKDKEYQLTEVEIRNLHKLLLKEPYLSDAITAEGIPTKKEIKLGEYKQTPNHVKTPTGAIHYYASVEETPIKMGELMNWYTKIKDNKEVHPLVIATLFHHQLVAIHPFDDGNGRMARLLMNLILLQKGFPAIVVKQEDRMNYYQVLRQADASEYLPIIEYMGEVLKHSLGIYLRGAKGEPVDDKGDIKKEVALLKQTIETQLKGQKREFDELQKAKEITLKSSIIKVFEAFLNEITPVKELFAEEKILIGVHYATSNHGYNNFLDFKKAILEIKNLEFTEIYLRYNLADYKHKGSTISFSESIDIRVVFSLKNYSIRQSTTNQILNQEYKIPIENEVLDIFVKNTVQHIIKNIQERFS